MKMSIRWAVEAAKLFRQLCIAGKREVSPLTIEITSVNDSFAHLKIGFTIFGLTTPPFHDFFMALPIADGSEPPRFVNTSPDLTANRDAQDISEKCKKKEKLIAQICYANIYSQFFESDQGNIDFELDKLELFDFEITAYPVGDVAVYCDWALLKAEQYNKDFLYLGRILQMQFPDASFTSSNCKIVVSF